MDQYFYVHNPRCSKSREALTILEARGITPIIIDYLNGELNQELLQTIITALGPRDIVRTKEDEFKDLSIDLDNVQDVTSAILKLPKLLERPILIKGKQAVIGRPPENVLKLIKN